MKHKFNKMLTLTLCLVLLVSIMSPTFATEESANQTSPIKLTSQPIVFNVAVPTGLPVDVNAQGEVTVAMDAKIENHSAAPISIAGVQVNPITDWNIVTMNKDFKGTQIGTKEFGFILNSDEVPAGGTVALTKANWPSINGSSSLSLVYDSVVAPQKDAISSNKIADVVFTIGWDAVETEVPVAPPAVGTKHVEGNYEYSYGQNYRGAIGSWTNSNLSGWGVKVIENTQTSYVQPLENIQGQPVVSYYSLFYGYPNSTLILEGTWTNKNIKSMDMMFYNSQATSLDLSSFNSSNVTTMSSMFYNSYAKSLDLSNFDTSKVWDMFKMFYGSRATSLDLSCFNTSSVTRMNCMFEACQTTTLDLSSLNTSNVTDMSLMFQSSYATTLDLSSFDTSNVTGMRGMFTGSSATSLDLSSFDISNVSNMENMFYKSRATMLDLSSFDTSNVTNMRNMFRESQATTGYARTQDDANKFNATSERPSALKFMIKPA